MSRWLVRNSANYLRHSGAVVTGLPVTVALWYRPSNVGQIHNLVQLRDVATGHQCLLTFDGNAGVAGVANSVVAVTSGAGGSTAYAVSATVFNRGALNWMHCGATWVSATERYAYLDGIPGSADTVSRTPVGLNELNVGTFFSGASSFNTAAGHMAEIGIWKSALHHGEMRRLANGERPISVRPQDLVAYYPFDTPDLGSLPDRRFPLAVNGSFVFLGPHAPVRYAGRAPFPLPFALDAITHADGQLTYKTSPAASDRRVYLAGGGLVAKAAADAADRRVRLSAGQWVAA